MKSIKQRLPGKINSLFKALADIADKQGIEVYAVGGFVRDLILDANSEDIDIVVSNSGDKFANDIAQSLNEKLEKRSQFNTYAIHLRQGIHLDIATARKESYSSPAALPDVSPGDLRSDLQRRDFTINSLAFGLNTGSPYTLIDPFNGYEDLRNGTIRAHHKNSFIDDPCRIFRALRFKTRFNYRLETDTELWLKKSIEDKIPGLLSGHRIWNEIQRTLKEERLLENLLALGHYSLLNLISPHINKKPLNQEFLKNIPVQLNWLQENEKERQFDKWVVRCLALLLPLERTEIESLAGRFQWNHSLKEKIVSGCNSINTALPLLKNKIEKSRCEIYELFDPLEPEALAAALAQANDSIANQSAELYLKDIRQAGRIELNGDDLIRLGLKPGPVFNKIFSTLRNARLNGHALNKEDEESIVKKEFL